MPERIEIAVRLGCFGCVLLVMTLWELAAPRRSLTVRKGPRWASNLGLITLNVIAVRLLFPVSVVASAVLVESRGVGVLNRLDWPIWLEVPLAILAFDLAIYLQHVMFHAVPLLWRLHMVHHADLDFDVTTGLRFHTLEIALSTLIKLAVVAVIGPAALAVVIFEVLLNAAAMFNHSNVRISTGLDRFLRWIVVTPDMHRVHHSVIRRETNSNFGFNVPWWDHLFGTYLPQPSAGHEAMSIGLATMRDEGQVDRLPGMLLIPFTGSAGPYAINRQGDERAAEVHHTECSGRLGSRSDATETGIDRTTNPMDRLAGEYDDWFDTPDGQELFQLELACVQTLTEGDQGRWLEVGVGTGRFAEALKIQAGVDPSEPAIQLARRRGINAILGAAEQLPFSDASFDGILLVTTLCFVNDPIVAMKEFRRVVTPGGFLVIGMIPRDSPWGQLYVEKGRAGHPFYSTAHFHTTNEVIALAEGAGFRFQVARSCLLNSPKCRQTSRIEEGIAEGAGFVCLKFSAG